MNIWRPVFGRDKVRFQERNNLSRLADMLSKLPSLKQIVILFDHPDVFKTWTDFWGDLAALSGTGAMVKIGCLRGFGFRDFCRFAWSQGGRFVPVWHQEDMGASGGVEYQPHYNGDALVSPDEHLFVRVVSLEDLKDKI